MGDKIEAKKPPRSSAFLWCPAPMAPSVADDDAMAIAQALAFPVLVKAARAAADAA